MLSMTANNTCAPCCKYTETSQSRNQEKKYQYFSGCVCGCCIPLVNYRHSFLCAEVDALNDNHSVVIH